MNVHVKTRPPGQSPQPEDIAHFMQILSCIPDAQTACWMGTEFLAQLAPQDLQEATVALSHVHPFFLPDIDNDAAENLKLCLGRFAETVLQARLTANRAKNLNLLVAGTPGSADIVGHALRRPLGLRSANLVTMAYSDYSASLFGANLSSKSWTNWPCSATGWTVSDMWQSIRCFAHPMLPNKWRSMASGPSLSPAIFRFPDLHG